MLSGTDSFNSSQFMIWNRKKPWRVSGN